MPSASAWVTSSRPGATGSTTVTIAPQNITPGKASTEFAVFVQPDSGSGVLPRIVGVEQDGKMLPVQFGRPYSLAQCREAHRPGRGLLRDRPVRAGHGPRGRTEALHRFLHCRDDLARRRQRRRSSQRGRPGAVRQGVRFEAGLDRTTMPAADFNQNGIINLYDAKAIERNMPPLTPNSPLERRHQPGAVGPGALRSPQELGRVHHEARRPDRWLHHARQHRPRDPASQPHDRPTRPSRPMPRGSSPSARPIPRA